MPLREYSTAFKIMKNITERVRLKECCGDRYEFSSPGKYVRLLGDALKTALRADYAKYQALTKSEKSEFRTLIADAYFSYLEDNQLIVLNFITEGRFKVVFNGNPSEILPRLPIWDKVKLMLHKDESAAPSTNTKVAVSVVPVSIFPENKPSSSLPTKTGSLKGKPDGSAAAMYNLL